MKGLGILLRGSLCRGSYSMVAHCGFTIGDDGPRPSRLCTSNKLIGCDGLVVSLATAARLSFLLRRGLLRRRCPPCPRRRGHPCEWPPLFALGRSDSRGPEVQSFLITRDASNFDKGTLLARDKGSSGTNSCFDFPN